VDAFFIYTQGNRTTVNADRKGGQAGTMSAAVNWLAFWSFQEESE